MQPTAIRLCLKCSRWWNLQSEYEQLCLDANGQILLVDAARQTSSNGWQAAWPPPRTMLVRGKLASHNKPAVAHRQRAQADPRSRQFPTVVETTFAFKDHSKVKRISAVGSAPAKTAGTVYAPFQGHLPVLASYGFSR